MQVEGRDAAIARIAARQYGVVTRAQLVAAGLGRGSIEHRVSECRLHRVHRGVYLVGHVSAPPLAREMAAVLACGPDAVLSHQSAASMWSLLSREGAEVDVTVAERDPGNHPGIRLHRARRLHRIDVRRCQRMPVTAPARTLLDLAAVIPLRDLERAVEEARVRRLVRPRQLLDVLERSPGRRGAGALRGLLDDDPALTRSEAETRLLGLLRAARLAPTAVNARVGRYGGRLSLACAAARGGGRRLRVPRHTGRVRRDRARDAELQAVGHRVIRVTWRQLVGEPEAVIARIAQALAQPR